MFVQIYQTYIMFIFFLKSLECYLGTIIFQYLEIFFWCVFFGSFFRTGLLVVNFPKVFIYLQACSVPLVLVQRFCCIHKSGLATVICSHHLVYIIPLSSGFRCCWVDFCYSNYLSFLCTGSVLFLAAFKIFSLSLMFCSFTTMCLGMDSFYYSF